MLKYLGQALHRYFGAVVQQPMPWHVIDRLASLEEREESETETRGDPPDVIPDEGSPLLNQPSRKSPPSHF